MPERISLDDGTWARLLDLKRSRANGDLARSDADAAWSLYAPIAGARDSGFVVAQVGQSLDGRVATPSGDAREVSGTHGMIHLHRCRALVDAVIVGVRTALADDPRLTVRLVPGDSPVRVVIDPGGRLPASARILNDGGPPVIVIHRAGRAPAVDATTIGLPARDGGLDPGDIVEALRERGMKRLLVEGGADTIGRFVDAGQVDSLHVSVSPIIIGSGPNGLSLRPIEALNMALRPRTRTFDLGTDILFECRFGAG